MTNDPNSKNNPMHPDRPYGQGAPQQQPGAGAPRHGQTLADQASQTAEHVAGAARNAASSVAGMATEEASTRFDKQKVQVASGLGSVAGALRKAGDELRHEDQHVAPRYFAMAADQIENLSGYLQSADLGQIVDEVEDFARRRPMVFAGGAFALGLLAMRFLNSSSHKRANMRADTRGLAPRQPYRATPDVRAAAPRPAQPAAGLSGMAPRATPPPAAPRPAVPPTPPQHATPPQPPIAGAPQPHRPGTGTPGNAPLPAGNRPLGSGEKV